MVGYSFDASVTLEGTSTVVPVTVTDVDLANGSIFLDLNTVLDTAVPVGSHTWRFSWTDTLGYTRPIFAGPYLVSPKP